MQVRRMLGLDPTHTPTLPAATYTHTPQFAEAARLMCTHSFSAFLYADHQAIFQLPARMLAGYLPATSQLLMQASQNAVSCVPDWPLTQRGHQ